MTVKKYERIFVGDLFDARGDINNELEQRISYLMYDTAG